MLSVLIITILAAPLVIAAACWWAGPKRPQHNPREAPHYSVPSLSDYAGDQNGGDMPLMSDVYSDVEVPSPRRAGDDSTSNGYIDGQVISVDFEDRTRQ